MTDQPAPDDGGPVEPRTLSDREGGARVDSTLHEGMTPHLTDPLRRWSNEFASGKLGDRVSARLQIAPPSPDDWWSSGPADLAPDRLLDIIDMALQIDQSLHFEVELVGPEPGPAAGRATRVEPTAWPTSSRRARAVEELDELLSDGRSVYRVWWGTPLRLIRRTGRTTQAAVEKALTDAEPSAGQLLGQAWAAAYAPTPEATGSYRDAVRAVEEVIRPLVLPDEQGATLGKVNAHLRQAGHKWELVLLDRGGDGTVVPLLALLERIWEGQVSRHGGGPRSRDQTVEEARAATQIAVLVVQWLTDGVLRRRDQPSTP